MGGKEIDWNRLHQRMAAVKATIEQGWIPSPEERTRILRERAAALAVAEEKKSTEKTIEVVEFLLAREQYGIESSSIREVYPLKDYTPLPGVPDFVLGLLNVRGRILSVVDVKKFFDLPDKGISDLNKVIIISDDMMEFGILADEILGVRNITLSELDQPLPTLTGILGKFVRGVTGERLVVLDAARILASPDIVVHEEV